MHRLMVAWADQSGAPRSALICGSPGRYMSIDSGPNALSAASNVNSHADSDDRRVAVFKTATPTRRTRRPKDGNQRMSLRRRIAGCLITMTGLLAVAPAAHAGIYGTDPLAISLNPATGSPDGPSAHPAVSGDNRKTHYAAFDSTATNLVGGDTNGQPDVFVWSRPRGSAGLRLSGPSGRAAARERQQHRRPGQRRLDQPVAGRLDAPRAPLRRLPVDGVQPRAGRPRRDARTSSSAICARTGRSSSRAASPRPRRTRRSTASCTPVAFEAGGEVYVAQVHGGRPHRIASGGDPDYALDGSAIVWVHGGDVYVRREGHTDRVGPGERPTVGDDDSGKWAISFDTTARLARNDTSGGRDVYQRLVHADHGPYDTDLISATRRGGHSLGGNSFNGGVTAYAGTRGIVVFVNDQPKLLGPLLPQQPQRQHRRPRPRTRVGADQRGRRQRTGELRRVRLERDVRRPDRRPAGGVLQAPGRRRGPLEAPTPARSRRRRGRPPRRRA